MADYFWAIKRLSANAEFQIWDNDLSTINWIKNPDNITEEQIIAEGKIMDIEYDADQYKRDRQLAYIKDIGSWEEQLDMIYHDIDNWKAEVKKIKDKYPKGEG
tara:strand:+ start:563 stop:871 length:309 start_codon:yes stop_codon:yes gene_type:complete